MKDFTLYIYKCETSSKEDTPVILTVQALSDKLANDMIVTMRDALIQKGFTMSGSITSRETKCYTCGSKTNANDI